jgi:hypothetical protein
MTNSSARKKVEREETKMDRREEEEIMQTNSSKRASFGVLTIRSILALKQIAQCVILLHAAKGML